LVRGGAKILKLQLFFGWRERSGLAHPTNNQKLEVRDKFDFDTYPALRVFGYPPGAFMLAMGVYVFSYA